MMEPMQSVSAVSQQRNNRRGPTWSGDPSKSPRCGAKTRSGAPCRAPAMWSKRARRYTRCRLHGGASTGPKTPEGQERCRKANWKHGWFSEIEKAEQRSQRMAQRQFRLAWRQELAEIRDLVRQVRRMRRLEKRQPEVIAVLYAELSGAGTVGKALNVQIAAPQPPAQQSQLSKTSNARRTFS